MREQSLLLLLISTRPKVRLLSVRQEGCLGPSAGEKPSVSILALYFRNSLLLMKYLTWPGQTVEGCFNHFQGKAQVKTPVGFHLPTEQDNCLQTGSGTFGRTERCHRGHPDISTAHLGHSNTPFSLQSLEPPSLFKENRASETDTIHVKCNKVRWHLICPSTTTTAFFIRPNRTGHVYHLNTDLSELSCRLAFQAPRVTREKKPLTTVTPRSSKNGILFQTAEG